ncbi:MAG: ATP-grasp domain-containing protein [Fimbriiglobus sp.]
MTKPMLVIGASVRAAMQSARRAGYTPYGVDLFADRDARRIAAEMRTIPLAEYPQGFIEAVKAFPRMPWFYTGGLENHPTLIEEIAKTHTIAGNHRALLGCARNSTLLLLSENSQVPIPETLEECPDDTTGWLEKRDGSSGGLGVRWATGPKPDCIFQRYVPGRSFSAVVYSSGYQHNIVGLTEQLIGQSWLHAREFQYCGNIGPITLSEPLLEQVSMIQRRITGETSLQHIWGFDCIESAEGVLLIEINPRYPASAEVLEYASGESAMSLQPILPKRSIGKAIYYAAHDIRFPAHAPFEEAVPMARDPWALPPFADLPAVGSLVSTGDPVLTILVAGSDRADCYQQLQSQAHELDQLFAECQP